MIIKKITRITFYFLFSYLVMVLSALALEGTIVTKSGEKYENVQYKVLDYYKAVSIQLDGKKKNISFSEIEAIYDEDGYNIAADLLKNYYRPTNSEEPSAPVDTIESSKIPETMDTLEAERPVEVDTVGKVDTVKQSPQPFQNEWRSETDKVYSEASKKLWNVGFRIGANFSVPLGDYYEGIEAGVGYEGDFMVAVTNNIALRATVSKAGLKWKYQFGYYSLDPNYEFIEQDFSLSVIRYLFAVQYYNRIDRETPGRSIWYAVTGLGATVHKSTYKGKLRNTVTLETVPLEEVYSETKFTVNAGFGIIYLMSKNFGIDAGINFDMLYIGSVEDNGNKRLQTAGILDFKVALITLL